jgi:hypothetical protein
VLTIVLPRGEVEPAREELARVLKRQWPLWAGRSPQMGLFSGGPFGASFSRAGMQPEAFDLCDCPRSPDQIDRSSIFTFRRFR